MSNDDDIELLKEDIASWCAEMESRPKEEGKFGIKFADSFIDSFAELCNKSEEDLAKDEETHKQKLLNILKVIEGSGEPIKIFSNGYLYLEPVELSEYEKENPEYFGYKELESGTHSWPCSWSDVFLSYGDKESIWICVAQNKPSQVDHKDVDLRITNECLQEAFRDKDRAMIEYWQGELLKLEEHFKKDIQFRTLTLDTEDYLTKELLVKAIQVWVASFYPSLLNRSIEIVPCTR